MNKMIEFKNVTKIFTNTKKHKKALDKINFTVKTGEFHGFIGANGAGKTTSIRTLLGFYPHYEGEVIVNGINVKDDNFKKILGYIPEVATFPKTFNVYEYLITFGELSGLTKEEATKKVDALLKEMAIPEEIYIKKGGQLSSGQQKKVLLVQALINDPKLLILDEPAANLDPKARIDLYETLKRLNQKGVTIFISSHILSELEIYIDSYTIMENGQVKENTTVNNIRQQNENRFKVVSNEINKIKEFILTLNESDYTWELNDNTLLINSTKDIFKKLATQIINNDFDFEYIGKDNKSLNELYFNAYNAE
ncbi:ABC transporter ATP-binding protein [Mycoplasma sp. OR1901]|uniref:ABC transporter ATP-binding protein n=1 Tax=Mycoplasma sp. OR1901 TaxID=2742195 RepID=UPI0020C667E1|nr:ABC transporter ATP-binding protein [Mycoplasma sp. OR1901]